MQIGSSRSLFWRIHGLHMNKEVLGKLCALAYIFLSDKLAVWCAGKGQTCIKANPAYPCMCCTSPLVHHFLYQPLSSMSAFWVHLHLSHSFVHIHDKQTALVQQWRFLQCSKSLQAASTQEQNCCRLKVVSVVWLTFATESTCAVVPCKGVLSKECWAQFWSTLKRQTV